MLAGDWRTSQPGGFIALLFCASCTTARISASVCRQEKHWLGYGHAA